MWLRTACNLHFRPVHPTPFIFMLRPRSGVHQWVARELYSVQPGVPVSECEDRHGNLCQRLVTPPGGDFSVRTSADVMVRDQADVAPEAPFTLIQDLPDSALVYLLPSRYCESDRLGQLAREITVGLRPGYQQAAYITEWVHRNVRYNPGTSSEPISALEVKARGHGVCRDLAHLALALCRSLSIPARIVAGYLQGLEPMDLHAWLEAYVGGRWYTFDPAQGNPGGGRVVLGYGRDAADVAILTSLGLLFYQDSWKFL